MNSPALVNVPTESNPEFVDHITKEVSEIFAHPVQREHEPYYELKPSHAEKMNKIYQTLDDAGPKVENGIMKAKELLKERVNPDMLRRALGIYLTHSRDAQQRKIAVPPLKNHAPFLDAELAVVAGEVVTSDTFQGPAILSYWREDYDYNDHHVHWHMVFPGTGVRVNGENVKVIDRQGELFLYMHSQMVVRYETEGLCWNLPPVRSWNQYDDVLESGYAPVPALIGYYGGYAPFSSWFAVRNPNIPDVPDAPVSRAQLETWRDNIYQAIKDGYFWTKNKSTGETKKFPLTGDNCLDIVGVVVEAESVDLKKLADGFVFDEDLYGNLHSFGHDKFAELGYHKYLTKTAPYGLMISNFGSPRDACFYPWHKHIQYFGRLAAAAYPQDITEHRAEVVLSNLSILPQDKSSAHYGDGGITTFLQPPAINLMESKAKLDHEPYQWSVDVKSSRSNPPSKDHPQNFTLRLFIAAKELMDDYHNWIEMDKISIHLTDESSITKVRLDADSSVARKMGKYNELNPDYISPWCRCGWPQNMMLPVGKVDGMLFVAFCMATDDSMTGETRTPALSYCGALQKDRKYPDPRGMGYPFNRTWTQQVNDKTGKASISSIISNSKDYPFITTSSFKIFRTTQLFQESVLNPPKPPSSVTWFNTIKNYFLPEDSACMLKEYGFNLSDYDDVYLHSAAIYDSTRNKRMPLQMPPYTQKNPDPKHPLWTTEMCGKFHAWMLNGCPKGSDSS
jgi:tyrosinase